MFSKLKPSQRHALAGHRERAQVLRIVSDWISEVSSPVAKAIIANPETFRTCLTDASAGLGPSNPSNTEANLVRAITVNSSEPLEGLLKTSDRVKYVDRSFLSSITPPRKGGVLKLHYFLLRRILWDEELRLEYIRRGLRPEPYVQAIDNITNPEFADTHPNGTHWRDPNGHWCYMAFDNFYGSRRVDVDKACLPWHTRWWFCGVPV